MSSVDVLIPLIPGTLLVAFPQMLTPKTASAEEAARRKSKLRETGYVLLEPHTPTIACLAPTIL